MALYLHSPTCLYAVYGDSFASFYLLIRITVFCDMTPCCLVYRYYLRKGLCLLPENTMSHDHNAVRTEAVSCLSVAKISFQLWGSFLCTRKRTKLPSDWSPARIQPVYLGLCSRLHEYYSISCCGPAVRVSSSPVLLCRYNCCTRWFKYDRD